MHLAQTVWWHGAIRDVQSDSSQNENGRLKKIVAELELDKLIFKESLDHLEPKARRQTSFVRPYCTADKSWQPLNGAHVGFWARHEVRCNTKRFPRTMGCCVWQ